MRLQKPATYWEELEKQYLSRGRLWALLSALTVFLFVVGAIVVVYQPPKLFNDAAPTLGGIKGALLLAAAVSMIIYLINLFVKMTMSAYHLALDARERRQLTYVFLALIKHMAIEAKDREVVLAALFSRADTGLIKGESGPTIPTPWSTLIDAVKGRG
jgi:Ca2+/H+ antiporter